jgi:DNA polymerase-3 subunit delta
LDAGRPLPLALSQARIFGPRQGLLERASPRFSAAALARLLCAAAACDGVAKGLKRADWPAEPWDAVRRLVLMSLHFSHGAVSAGRGRKRGALALGAEVQ